MKVGIITHYYKSTNYGGNLQAYALCRVIEGMGHTVEQISFDTSRDKGLVYSAKRLARKILKPSLKNRSNFAIRKKAFEQFNQGLIPHSRVYSEKNIHKCVNDYDVFITGSDQVWHPFVACNGYLLEFVPSSKKKLSYSASIAHNELTEKQRERYKNALSDYSAISVRENEAVEILKPLASKKIEVVLDPTLLLTKNEWLEIADDVHINEDYIFCYFLGSDEKQRSVASEFARKNNLKIATLPHLLGQYRECDSSFGDYKLYDVTPQKLISIINNSKCVFTDSFHATVFSLICEKEHFVFQRSGHKSMSSRIYTLCSLFDTQEHFCDTEDKTTLSYIESLEKIDYSKEKEAFVKQKEASLAFLKSNLE